MEPIHVFKKNERDDNWEVAIIIGHESRGVGFVITIDKSYWEELTKGRRPPEDLARRSLEFLLRRRGSPFTIPRILNIRDIESQFEGYESAMRARA